MKIRTKIPVDIQLVESKCRVLVSRETADIFKRLLKTQKLYEGTKIREVVEAVYRRGCKDGADAAMMQLQKQISKAREMLK